MFGTIPKYTHRCVVQSGPGEGNKWSWEPDAIEIQYETPCPECGEVPSLQEIVAHMYEELTN